MMKSKFSDIPALYYVLAALCYALTLFTDKVRPGIAGAALMVIVFVSLAVSGKVRFGCIADAIAAALFLYQVLSVIWLLAGGYPLSVYTGEFVSSTLPMVFYFAGRYAGDGRKRWYAYFSAAVLFLGICGIILYISAPSFYINWAYKWSYISKADADTLRVRMHSFIGSTCLSYLGVCGILAGSSFLAETKTGETETGETETGGRFFCLNKLRQKNRPPVSVSPVSVFIMVVSLLTAVMANQRSGIVAAGIALVFINWIVFFRLDIIPKKYFMIEIAVLAAAFAVLGIVRIEYLLKYWYRIASLPTAVSQRSEQWVAAVNNMYSSWIGNGLGANGHRAIGFEDAHVIADGGLVKMYCENGVLGFSLFIYLLYLALGEGIRDIRDHYAEVGIIVAGLLQSIGSNILAFQICAPVFWFAVGACLCSKKESA